MRILKSELLLGSGRGREAEAYSEAVARLRLSPPQVRVAPDLCLYPSPPMPTSVCDAPPVVSLASLLPTPRLCPFSQLRACLNWLLHFTREKKKSSLTFSSKAPHSPKALLLAGLLPACPLPALGFRETQTHRPFSTPALCPLETP